MSTFAIWPRFQVSDSSISRLACLGAVVIIAALGIGFSFQALVVYPLRPNWVDDAKIERTNFHYGSTKCMAQVLMTLQST